MKGQRHRQAKLYAARKRSGAVAVYVVLILVVLIGFVALGVDIGRLQLAKTELQVAADAAARAGAWAIPSQHLDSVDYPADSAEARAVQAAGANTAAGVSVSLVPGEDIAYGFWNPVSGTFTELTGSERSGANAIRVTTRRIADRGNPLSLYFAPVIGHDHADVEATATAMIRGDYANTGIGYGIIGLDWVQMGGTTETDSYNAGAIDAATGMPIEYSEADRHYGGTIATNGYIRVNGTIDVYGDARPGLPDGAPTGLKYPDGEISQVGGIIHGTNPPDPAWTAPLDRVLEYPAPEPPASYNNQPLIDAGYLTRDGDFVLNGKEVATIPGGTDLDHPAVYYIDGDLTMTGNTEIIVEGPVKIYVSGNVDLTGSITVNQGLPANFEIIALSPNTTVELGGGSQQYAHVYAPLSDVKIHGTSSEFGLFGAVVGKTIDIIGNSAIHYDESGAYRPGGTGAFWVQTVR